MNLHDIKAPFKNIAIWTLIRGANGRDIGTHLYEFDEGKPEPMIPMSVYQNRAWWTPEHFSWVPFRQSIDRMFENGYVRPLCDHRSATRWPSAHTPSFYNPCTQCGQIAREQGKIAISMEHARLISPTYAALMTERREWEAAGRPDTWPLT